MASYGIAGGGLRLLTWNSLTATAPVAPSAPLPMAPPALLAPPAPVDYWGATPPLLAPPPPPPPAPPAPPMAPPPAPPIPPLAPAPTPAGFWTPPTQLMDSLRTEIARLQSEIGRIVAAVVPAPAPEAPKPEAPPKPVAQPAPAPKPQPKPEPKPPSLYASRDSWFISQYGSAKYNSREDVPGIDNANCGPTSLTMAATAFGKINPSPSEADAAIEKSRRMMGDSQSERSGTSGEGIARGAKAYGLDATIVNNIDLNDIKAELAKGRLPVINGNYIRADGSIGGGHFYIVTKIEGDKAYLNDPAIASGPRVISTSLLMKSVTSHWSRRLVSIGPGK